MSNYLINGKAVNQVPVTDRGLQYGDGVFETLRVERGSFLHWGEHMARLQMGCQRLHLPLPDIAVLKSEAEQLIGQDSQSENAIVKIIITRGSGQRGYALPEPQAPTRILALYPLPDYPKSYWATGVKTTICKTRLACNRRLAGIKHLNRLEQILARSEWEDSEIVEGIMLDKDQHVIEGTMSNLFWFNEDKLCTSDLSECGVEGVMRKQILQLAKELQLPVMISHYFIEDLLSADEIFITNSIYGIWPVRQIDEYVFNLGSKTKQLMDTIQ
ncbi:MAG: aminodeoxychorismate lyase [Gammaproteobacteria bacterium]